MVGIDRVGDLVRDSINYDEIFIDTLEDHGTENCLIIRLGFAAWNFEDLSQFENPS